MATVDCGMHQTSVGVLVMLCEDTIMRIGEAEGKRDFLPIGRVESVDLYKST